VNKITNKLTAKIKNIPFQRFENNQTVVFIIGALGIAYSERVNAREKNFFIQQFKFFEIYN